MKALANCQAKILVVSDRLLESPSDNPSDNPLDSPSDNHKIQGKDKFLNFIDKIKTQEDLQLIDHLTNLLTLFNLNIIHLTKKMMIDPPNTLNRISVNLGLVSLITLTSVALEQMILTYIRLLMQEWKHQTSDRTQDMEEEAIPK